MKKSAIIFGVTGQDGSYLAENLLGKGYDVTGIIRRSSTPNTKNINHLLQRINIVEGDITDAFSVTNIINETNPDEIYNLAAQSHVATSFKQPSFTWEVTAGGPLNILEAIKISPRKNKIKFYQASSSEMFGRSYDVSKDDLFAPKKKYQNENTPFLPQSPYAVAKLAAHHLVRNYRDSYGIFACSGILFNHESERRGENFVTRKITKWLGQFKVWAEEIGYTEQSVQGLPSSDWIYGPNQSRFKKLRLGNLLAKRDWGHAEDYVEAMWLMLQHDQPDDYVVATGETYTIENFLSEVFRYANIHDWRQYVVIDPLFYRPNEVDYLLGDPEKAEIVLKWNRKVSFKELAKRMVEHDINEARLQRPHIQKVSQCCSQTRQTYLPNV